MEENATHSQEQYRLLETDERKDEAVLEKIRGNIYDVFKTVLLAAQKAKSEESDQKEFFRNNLNNIPRGWKIAYEQAEKNGDSVKVLQEKVKLEALSEIEEAYETIWG